MTEPTRPEAIEFVFDQRRLSATPGQTLAAALLAAGVRTWGTRRQDGAPCGVYCGIGVCYGCHIVLNGRPNTRACLVRVEDGDTATTQEGTGHDHLA